MLESRVASYEWAKLLNFTSAGNAQNYCMSGWAKPEEGLTWTDGLNAKLRMSVKPPVSDVSLVLSCFPFLGDGKVPYQEVTVFVNFLRVGFAVIDGAVELEVPIPRHVFRDSHTEIDLYLPRACSPSAIGAGSDMRRLGLAVNRMMMMQV
ncbi:MAG TPA: hypothetical protein VKS60_17100 [Stellaceae bacterium]|nr:hypothetical protein [Stellaceae bacterium]